MRQNVKKMTLYLFALRMLRIFLSIIILAFSANFFGVSIERDIWILVSTFLVSLCAAVWGPINEIFRAKFIFISEEEGKDLALEKTQSLLSFVILVTFLISLLLLFFSSEIVAFIGKNMASNSFGIFAHILLILIPTFLLNELTYLGISILNAYDVYYVPEVVGVLTGILNLLIIVWLAPFMGIYSLAVSQYVSLFILLLAIVYFFKIKGINVWCKCYLIRWRYVKCFLVFALPFFFPYFVGQCNTFIEKWIAGWLGEGNVSIVDYARQFTVVLQNVMSSVLATIMIPMLAKAYSQQRMDDFLSILKEYITISFGIVITILSFLFGAAKPFCEIFFLRGAMTVEAIDKIVILVQMYSVAFIGVLLYLILGMSLLASNKGKQYAFWGIITQLVVLAFNLVLYKKLSINIFPISLGIGHLLSAMIMGSCLEVKEKAKLFILLFQYIFLFILVSSIVWILNICLDMKNAFVQLFLVNGLFFVLLSPLISCFFGVNPYLYVRRLFLK